MDVPNITNNDNISDEVFSNFYTNYNIHTGYIVYIIVTFSNYFYLVKKSCPSQKIGSRV